MCDRGRIAQSVAFGQTNLIFNSQLAFNFESHGSVEDDVNCHWEIQTIYTPPNHSKNMVAFARNGTHRATYVTDLIFTFGSYYPSACLSIAIFDYIIQLYIYINSYIAIANFLRHLLLSHPAMIKSQTDPNHSMVFASYTAHLCWDASTKPLV